MHVHISIQIVNEYKILVLTIKKNITHLAQMDKIEATFDCAFTEQFYN